jgi:C-terminal processing protease CtpA/Prc
MEAEFSALKRSLVPRPGMADRCMKTAIPVFRKHWTQYKFDGKRYGGKKPVFILAGSNTKSAAEAFACTRQALKRATVLGERTWGGANASRPYRLGDYFVAFIPSRVVSAPSRRPIGKAWGFIPEVAATPDNALAGAMDLMERRLQGAAPAVAAGR